VIQSLLKSLATANQAFGEYFRFLPNTEWKVVLLAQLKAKEPSSSTYINKGKFVTSS
jgi:hypothetical protein